MGSSYISVREFNQCFGNTMTEEEIKYHERVIKTFYMTLFGSTIGTLTGIMISSYFNII